MIPKWNEWLLFIWFIGLVVSDIMNPSDRSGLGVIRVCVQVVGFLAIALHIAAFIVFTFIVDVEQERWSVYRLDTLYGRNQLLAVAMLLSFIEFLNFLTFHPLFGPWVSYQFYFLTFLLSKSFHFTFARKTNLKPFSFHHTGRDHSGAHLRSHAISGTAQHFPFRFHPAHLVLKTAILFSN